MEPNAPDTSNFLDWVEIKNFKSIKDLRLDCKRVNIFIGKPNVGKSNILEALGLLSSQSNFSTSKFLEGSVRYETLKNLFYDSDISQSVTVQTENSKIELYLNSTDEQGLSFFNYSIPQHGNTYTLTENGKNTSSALNNIKYSSIVRKYDFNNLLQFKNPLSKPLIPPYGSNLYEVVYRNKELANEFGRLFQAQDLEFVLDTNSQNFLLQKKNDQVTYQYPYFSIADTFRRFMFYIAAIESNDNSVLIFEEPEVHSFPPYTQELAYRMINDTDNQYFISTHSPYMLHPFIEKMNYKDLNVFITYYEDYQTRVKALNYEEFRDILDYSTNVFFNLNHFTPNATNKVAP